jgi:RNA polymerase sigma factor (sigma-70 family)
MICDQLDLVVKAQAGDVKARNELIETNLDFIRYVVMFYKGRRTHEEYLTAGVMGFIKALEYFDVKKIRRHVNAIFWLCIRNELTNQDQKQDRAWQYADKIRRRARMLPIPDQPDRQLILKDLWGLLDRLGEKDRIIVMGRMNGETNQDLARRLGCCSHNVSWHYKRAIKALRAMWDKDLGDDVK